jgi:Carboxypeptidase regulatory-like domain/SdrD B-like domain
MNKAFPQQEQIGAPKSRTGLAVFKIVVVIGASAAVLVALVRAHLWGVNTMDVTILEVAFVPLIAAALYSLVASVAANGSPARSGPASPEQPPGLLDRALALPADPIPQTAISSRTVSNVPTAPAKAPQAIGAPQPRQGPVTISGVVTGRSGESVSGASVTAIDAFGREVARSWSDQSGQFTIDALEAGSYSVVFLAPPFRPTVRPVVLAAGFAIVDVTLHGRGTVWARVLGGRGRQPQVGVPVAMARPGGRIEHTTATDSTGRYRFDEVDEGEWVVLTGAPRHRDSEQRVYVVAGELVGEDLVLTALGEVAGEVAEGTDPIPGVRVTLVDDSGRIIYAARTDRAGTYGFTEVPEGTYVVVALMVEPRTSVAVVSSETNQSPSVPDQLLA